MNQEESKNLSRKIADRFTSKQLTDDGWVLLGDDTLMASQSDLSGTFFRIAIRKVFQLDGVAYSKKVERYFSRRHLSSLKEVKLAGSIVPNENGSAILIVERLITDPISDSDLGDVFWFLEISPLTPKLELENKFAV